MGYSHLLALGATLANFREAYGVLGDVNITYCHEGDIALERGFGPNVAFFPLMAILEGGVRFPVTLLLYVPLGFTACAPTNSHPIFTKL